MNAEAAIKIIEALQQIDRTLLLIFFGIMTVGVVILGKR